VAEKLRSKGRFWYNSFSHFYPIPIGRWRHRVELNLDGLRRIGVYPTEQERHLTLVPARKQKLSSTRHSNNMACGNSHFSICTRLRAGNSNAGPRKK